MVTTCYTEPHSPRNFGFGFNFPSTCANTTRNSLGRIFKALPDIFLVTFIIGIITNKEEEVTIFYLVSGPANFVASLKV